MSTLLIIFISLTVFVTVVLAALSIAALFDVKWLQAVFDWMFGVYAKWNTR